MFCQICGARIPEGRTSCVQCGAPAGGRSLATLSTASLSTDVRSCTRCGYQGQSQAYFASGMHLVALLAASAFFTPVAGMIYFALRYSHRMCPSCGLDWGKDGMLALPPTGEAAKLAAGQIPTDVAGLSDGGVKRFFSWGMFVIAAILVMAGLANLEMAPLVVSTFFGGGGYLLRRSANEDRMRRREAILQSLQRPVLQLAARRNGTLTVTEVAAEFGWSIPRAEKVLQSLEDGYRVMGDVTSDGVIVYNFLELVPLPPAASDRPPAALPVERPAGNPAPADPNRR